MIIVGRNYALPRYNEMAHRDFQSASSARLSGHTVVSEDGSGLVFVTKCDYPYSHTQDHLIVWYPITSGGIAMNEKIRLAVEKQVNKYRDLGYYAVHNPPSKQSIPRIGHVHLLLYNEEEDALAQDLFSLSIEHEPECVYPTL